MLTVWLKKDNLWPLEGRERQVQLKVWEGGFGVARREGKRNNRRDDEPRGSQEERKFVEERETWRWFEDKGPSL